MAAAFHLIAARECPRAEALLIAFALAGIRPARSAPAAGDHPPKLWAGPPGGAGRLLSDMAAMLRAIRGPGPGAGGEADRQAMRTGLRAMDRLDRLTSAASPADLDLEICLLRQELRKLTDLPPAGPAAPPCDRDILLLPLLWRLTVLDRHFGLYLLSGLENLGAHARTLAAQKALAPFTDAAAARRYVARVARRSALLTPGAPPADWSRALGPAGREKTLLPQGRIMKVSSIGRCTGFR